MSTNLGLPPRRELPGDVRERLRAKVTRGTRTRPVGWYAAAAVVLVVVVVASAAVWLRGGQPSAPVAASGPGGLLDRCWAAVEHSGKTAFVPPRAQWRQVYVDQKGDDHLVAISAADKPMFCEVTATTVTISDPSVPVRRPALLLYTATGLAAGVADPSIPNFDLYEGDLGITMSKLAPTGQFDGFTGLDPGKHQLSGWPRRDPKPGETGILYVGQRIPLASPPPPLLSVQDRGTPPGPLADCLAHAPQHVPDAASFQPGAVLNDGAVHVYLGRSGVHAVACTVDPNGHTNAYPDNFIGKSIPVRRLSIPGWHAFVGLAPADTTSMKADLGLGAPVSVPVTNGTFALWFPPGARSPTGDGLVWVLAENAQGAALFNGWIPLR